MGTRCGNPSCLYPVGDGVIKGGRCPECGTSLDGSGSVRVVGEIKELRAAHRGRAWLSAACAAHWIALPAAAIVGLIILDTLPHGVKVAIWWAYAATHVIVACVAYRAEGVRDWMWRWMVVGAIVGVGGTVVHTWSAAQSGTHMAMFAAGELFSVVGFMAGTRCMVRVFREVGLPYSEAPSGRMIALIVLFLLPCFVNVFFKGVWWLRHVDLFVGLSFFVSLMACVAYINLVRRVGVRLARLEESGWEPPGAP